MAKSRIFFILLKCSEWASVLFKIWLVVLVIWRENVCFSARARVNISVFKHCVSRAEEQRFSSGQFHLCKNFPRSFCQEKKKKGEEAESWAISFFSPIAQKWGWYCFQDTDRFEVTTTVVTNFTCCANKSTRFFFCFSSRLECKQLESSQSDTNYCNASTFTAKANQSLIKAEP